MQVTLILKWRGEGEHAQEIIAKCTATFDHGFRADI
jgi:hypothetical protein